MTPARYDAVAEAAKTVQDRIGAIPDIAIVLGSGLGSFASSAEVWLSHVNWALVAWVVLGLIVIRFVTWAFKPW